MILYYFVGPSYTAYYRLADRFTLLFINGKYRCVKRTPERWARDSDPECIDPEILEIYKRIDEQLK